MYFLSRVRRVLVHLWMRLCRVFPIEDEKIVVVSYYGRGYGDNGKAILRCLPQGLDVVWAAMPEEKHTLPESVRYVRYRSFGYYYEMATARVWIDNCRKPSDIIKRPGQYYMQTWHGGTALKRIERDAADKLSRGYLDDARQDSAMADVILSGSGYFTRLCRDSFWYQGEILECGTPRLDVLFHGDGAVRWQVLERLGVPGGKRVALYAPTFRASGGTDYCDLDWEALSRALAKRWGGEWVFILRLHPNAAALAEGLRFSELVYNGTDYPDLYELLPAADAVITDYSSIMFEAGMLHKPVLLYAPDLTRYEKERNFYFDLKELPFPLAQTGEELMERILRFDEESYRNDLTRFNDTMDYRETGNAAETAAGRIMEVIYERP